MSWAKLAIAGMVLLVAGCAREDGSRIIGHWQAERLEFGSIKLPIGPELTISRDALVAGSELRVPIEAITQDGDEITLDTSMQVGLSFVFVDDDRMYVDVPFVDRIYYRRVAAPPVLAAAPAMQPAAPQSEPQRQSAPAPAALANVQAGSYESALEAARQGDNDAAVRLLHRAFADGSARPAEVQADPEWDGLRGDVRFQALLARYGED